jgi:holo-[acyl-carrier protein] synthase
MILGVGSDLVDVRRIERVIARHGDRFILRIFTEAERAKAERRATRVETYAKRFAAKEACAKALGTGFRQGVYWRDIGVVNRGSGMPVLELRQGAATRLAALTPRGMVARIDLSLTDEPPFAHGMVVISAAPARQSPPGQGQFQGQPQGPPQGPPM